MNGQQVVSCCPLFTIFNLGLCGTRISSEKLSKKERKKRDTARRATWGAMSPVTRKTENGKGYNRKKAQEWKKAGTEYC